MFAEFLSVLHRGGAWVYFHYLPQRRSLWFEAGGELPAEPAAARTNLYFSVHPCRAIPPCDAHGEVKAPQWVRGQMSYIAAVNCLYAEYDAKHYGGKEQILNHIEALPIPPPSVVVDSGGGYHAYWLLKEPYTITSDAVLQAARAIQDRWVGLVGGDPGVKDLTRILRVPGSRNFKYDPAPEVCWVKADLALLYPLRVLTACLPPVKVATVEPVRYVAPIGGDKPIDAFNAQADVGALLSARGYVWRGNRRMVSPHSGSARDGVTISDNRAYVWTGGDPLCDGYWKRPFDVLRILDHGGDFKKALAAIRGDQ